jgi:MbtH protein
MEERAHMVSEQEDGNLVYLVLVNLEEQYSLWPTTSAAPKGWKVVKEGTKAECSAYIKDVWTDMRPLSLRKHMEASDRRTV